MPVLYEIGQPKTDLRGLRRSALPHARQSARMITEINVITYTNVLPGTNALTDINVIADIDAPIHTRRAFS